MSLVNQLSRSDFDQFVKLIVAVVSCDHTTLAVTTNKVSDLDDFFKARDKKYAPRHYERNSKGERLIKFNQAKLREFAEKLNVDENTILEQLSSVIMRGDAPQYILDLLAGKYDDVLIYKIGDFIDQPTVYYTSNTAEAAKHHTLEYKLGNATFTIQTDAAPRSARTFACIGYEYLPWQDKARLPPLCSHLLRMEAYSMPTMAAPRVWWDEATGSYAVRTPPSEDFMMFLKLIPEEDKKWDRDMKLWYVSPRMVDKVKDKIQRVFGSCSFIGPNTGPRPNLPMPSDTFSKFGRLVGKDALRKAYVDAAKRLHSDVGGDGKQMTELNVLWKEIEEVLR